MSFDEIMRCLPATDQKVIRDMMVLFDDINHQTEEFAKQSGLKCKSGCGACCTNPDIETTVAEVLPLAAHLWASAQADSALDTIRSTSSKSVCVFYKPDGAIKGQGRCGIYAYRPGICRLFGFAGRKDKYGQMELMTCKVIKDGQTHDCNRAQEGLKEGSLQAPLLTAHAMAVSNIDPTHGQELFPINQAIRLALEKVGYGVQKIKQ